MLEQLIRKSFSIRETTGCDGEASVGGIKASANLYSLVMTCRTNDINPYYYFQHLFTELPKRTPTDDLSDLMP